MEKKNHTVRAHREQFNQCFGIFSKKIFKILSLVISAQGYTKNKTLTNIVMMEPTINTGYQCSGCSVLLSTSLK